MDESKKSASNLTNDAYKGIKDMIIRGEIVPGERLNQKYLQDRFNVSRTPLMIAIAKLNEENLLVNEPNKGVYVKRLGLKEILDIYKIRKQLEPLGVFEAIKIVTPEDIKSLSEILKRYEIAINSNSKRDIVSIDMEFHSELMKMSENFYLFKIISNFDILILSNRVGLINTYENSLNDHKILLEYIKNKEKEKARETMYNHIDRAYKTLSRFSDLSKTYIVLDSRD